MKHVLAIFTVLVALTAPTRAASFSLTNDPSTGGPGKFAAEEIRREAVAHGMTLGDDAKATRVAVTVGKAGDATAQSYSIRVQNEGDRCTITVTEQWQDHIVEFEIKATFKDETTLRFAMPRDVKGEFDLADTRLKRAE